MSRNEKCNQSHKDISAFECTKRLIYELSLSCGAVYVGKTRRCPNTRLKGHYRIIDTNQSSTLKDHILKCRCKVLENKCQPLSRSNIKCLNARQILETICMENRKKDVPVVSMPTINPTEGEREYFEKRCTDLIL